jgi:hypothetical protein
MFNENERRRGEGKFYCNKEDGGQELLPKEDGGQELLPKGRSMAGFFARGPFLKMG